MIDGENCTQIYAVDRDNFRCVNAEGEIWTYHRNEWSFTKGKAFTFVAMSSNYLSVGITFSESIFV